jgi:hypothetical protein
MFGNSAKRSSVSLEVHRRSIGDVVDQDLPAGRLRDRLEMRVHAGLRRPVVIGADGNDAREREPFETLDGLDHLGGGVAADADEHGNAPGGHIDRRGDDRVFFFIAEGRRFAGRAERKQRRRTLADVVLDQTAVARQIDGPVLERRDKGDPDTSDHDRLHARNALVIGYPFRYH